MAGQIVLEGFLKIKTAGWIVRVATRLAALAPALLVIGLAGEGRVENLLIWSQVILSLQLGFACWPLVRMTSDAQVDGSCSSRRLGFACWAGSPRPSSLGLVCGLLSVLFNLNHSNAGIYVFYSAGMNRLDF